MAKAFFILVSLLAFFGCGSIEADPVYPTPTTFFPKDPADLPDVQAAVDRLVAATGRTDIAVAPGGVPIELVDDVQVAGHSACGGTFERLLDGTFFTQIRRDPPARPDFCMNRSSTILHEAIHALAPDSVHSDSGIFTSNANRDDRLDSASLEALCAEIDCPIFAPEL
jgi:hypothetical protein